ESPASWHLEAFVDRLIANNQDLLDDAIFYILPITNPDGVEGGYSRSNSIGIDLEGNFADSQKIVAAEVACIKRFLTSLKAGGLEPKLSLNMHAQSSPKISYWLHSASSTKREYNRRLRLMAHLTASDNRHFSPEQADETSLKGRYLEGWIRKHFHGRCIALTHELPYSYYNSEPNGEWVDKENLAEQSLNTLNAICEILNIKRKEQTRCSEPERYRGTKRRRDNTPYLGRGYLTAKRAGVRVPFTTELKRGSYNVMMWSAERGWHLAGYHIQQYDGEARFYYKCKTVGQIVDDVVFIKCDSWMAPS
ncbi:MAG: M14 family zinc carboxypeptidase, partial [Rikenellaceae bacterium]